MEIMTDQLGCDATEDGDHSGDEGQDLDDTNESDEAILDENTDEDDFTD